MKKYYGYKFSLDDSGYDKSVESHFVLKVEEKDIVEETTLERVVYVHREDVRDLSAYKTWRENDGVFDFEEAHDLYIMGLDEVPEWLKNYVMYRTGDDFSDIDRTTIEDFVSKVPDMAVNLKDITPDKVLYIKEKRIVLEEESGDTSYSDYTSEFETLEEIERFTNENKHEVQVLWKDCEKAFLELVSQYQNNYGSEYIKLPYEINNIEEATAYLVKHRIF